jgi:hypothetical protein
MASNFAQYTNGVVMPTGISEAGANIGRFAQQGLSSFGQSLGEGLQAYNENVAKDQVLQEEAKQLGSQIQQFAAQFGDSPEHAPFAESLKPYIEQLSKVPSMSLTQKMGAVTGVKAAFANIGQQLQAFEMVRKEKLQRTMAEAGMLAPKEAVVYNPSAIKAGTVAFDAGKTVQQNINDFDSIVSKAQAEGHEIDAEDARARYIANIRQSIKDNKQIDNTLRGTLIDQLDSYDKYSNNEMTNDGVTDYSKESELYNKIDTSALEKMKKKPEGAIASPNAAGYEFYQKQYEADIAKLEEEKKKILEADAEKTASEPFTKKKSPIERAADFGIEQLATNEWSPYRNIIRDSIKLDKDGKPQIAIGDLLKNYGKEALLANPGFKIPAWALSSGESPAEKLDKDKALALAISQSSTTTSKAKIEAIDKQIENTKSMLRDVSKTTGIPSPAVQQEQKPQEPESLKIGNQSDFIIGSKADVRKTTFDEKKAAMQSYFLSKYKDASGKSYLPAGFDEAFKAINPEANFQTMETPYGAFMWNGKEWNQIKTATPKTTKELREEQRGVFGVATENGIKPMEIGEGTGVALQGLYNGSDESLTKYKENISSLASARNAIEELKQIIGKFGHSVRPELIGRAKIAMATLRSATRIEVIGVGTVSEFEQKMLNDANPDPTGVFKFDSVDLAKLDSLSQKIDRKIKMESNMSGVTAVLRPPMMSRETREAYEAELRHKYPQLKR